MSNENTNTKMNKALKNNRSFWVGDFMSLWVMLLKLRMKTRAKNLHSNQQNAQKTT